MESNKSLPHILLSLSLIAYVVLGYFVERVSAKYFTESYEFPLFLSLFTVAFGVYLVLLLKKTYKLNGKMILIWAIVLRGALFFMMPNMSDDYFRFAWDGQMIANGINPFMDTPENLIDSEAVKDIEGLQPLYDGMNSIQYHTVYPPANQAVFTIAVWIGGDNIYLVVLIMRLFIFLAEIGTVILLLRLLRHFGKPESLAMIYAFNPLVITELTGNLHFEGLMLFWMMLAFYLLIKQRNHLSAICMAVAIGVKLIPLMLLPFLIRRIGWVKSIVYCTIVGVVLLIMFIPFISNELVAHFGESLDLYFQYFEFNASVFYLLRELGYLIVGWDPVRYVGPALSLIVLGTILFIAFRRKHSWDEIWPKMLFALLVYYGLAIIVHPWYISSLVLLSVFTQFRFALVWSAAILLSYVAYMTETYTESYVAVIIEYTAVYGYLIYEVIKLKRNRQEVLVTTAESQ